MHRNCRQSPGSRGGGEGAPKPRVKVLDRLYTPHLHGRLSQQAQKLKGRSGSIIRPSVGHSIEFQQGSIKAGSGGWEQAQKSQTKEAARFGFGMQNHPHLSPHPTHKAWELAGHPRR